QFERFSGVLGQLDHSKIATDSGEIILRPHIVPVGGSDCFEDFDCGAVMGDRGRAITKVEVVGVAHEVTEVLMRVSDHGALIDGSVRQTHRPFRQSECNFIVLPRSGEVARLQLRPGKVYIGSTKSAPRIHSGFGGVPFGAHINSPSKVVDPGMPSGVTLKSTG